ncbi:Sel1 repeat protein [Salmonella enterica]|nr:Sel1 repeat protein [Salmonella enterica]
MAGCYEPSFSYIRGESVKQNYRKAKELFGNPCDAEKQKGCDRYKELNE